ncbi:hypothetical protein EXIGLDRAFT_734433 [Exidia glandulosa HHB12029]|uniref:Copper-fist domain-containing protein n=1 Tax=Exidia glandulosa HHB12029 TaxID=1314781 RepID=A0A165Z613_EXIGL|nr:hypothetical protein EXIGLDRAFT_734433 [Exidia glandulosa HHB12029]
MIIDNKKYACATCIKGHRSSSCTHQDRPLIEVKKKGRPVTQCEHCRDLRKTKQVHIKCVCISRPDKVDDGEDNPRRKKARTSPPAPTFPNGLSDVPPSALVRSSVRPKREPTSCNCDLTGDCRCASQAKPAPSDNLMNSLILAAAAEANLSPAYSESRPTASASSSAQAQQLSVSYTAAASSSTARGSCCNPSPELSDSVESSPAHGIPAGSSSGAFEFPPMSQELASVFRCSCGATCACPGCTEHRGIDAFTSTESCPDSCASCFDCTVTSPAIHQWIENTSARLPEPPPSRSKAFGLDPHNLHVYAPVVWQNEDAARANGLVKVPALCCGGKCGCPPNACTCYDDCCGCCVGCACPEHETMPHYSGYQGTLRCNYQVSGERASCCNGEDSASSSPPPEQQQQQSFMSSSPFAFSSPSHSHSQASSSTTSLLSSYQHQQQLHQTLQAHASQQQQQQQQQSPSYPSGAYRRPSDRSLFSSIPPPPARTSTPPDSPLPRVPFQPAPGAFTLGQPNPQLFSPSSNNPLQSIYHPSVGQAPPVHYHDRDPRHHTLERVRG